MSMSVVVPVLGGSFCPLAARMAIAAYMRELSFTDGASAIRLASPKLFSNVDASSRVRSVPLRGNLMMCSRDAHSASAKEGKVAFRFSGDISLPGEYARSAFIYFALIRSVGLYYFCTR